MVRQNFDSADKPTFLSHLSRHRHLQLRVPNCTKHSPLLLAPQQDSSRAVTRCGTREETVPPASLQNPVTEHTSSWPWVVDAWTSRRFLLLPHWPALFIKDHPPSSKSNSVHKWKLSRGTAVWGGKWQFREAQEKQRSRRRLEVTLMAQHPSERETSSRRRQAKGPGLGESTHPTRRALGMVARRQIPTATGTAASLLASLRKKGFQSCKNNNKSSKNSRFSLFFFFVVWTNLRKKKDLRKTAGRWCQTLAETGACCLHFSRREKQVKGSERTACCDLTRRTNQVNFQSHDTGVGGGIWLLRSFTGNYFVVI